MKKNWYVIYSKAQFEKKIVNACNRKKLENYFPLKKVNKDPAKKAKHVYEPLLISLIFIKCAEENISEIKKMEGVISIMHWHDKAAIISETEIDAIKEFTSLYYNITVELSMVNLEEKVTNITNAVKTTDGNVYSINSKTIKVKLPSLGFTLVAETNVDPFIGRGDFNFKTDLLSRKQAD